MSVPQLSQNKLFEVLEVLISQSETLKENKKDSDKLLTATRQQLDRLEELIKEPVAVDIEAMRIEHERIKSTLEKGLAIPKWMAISFLSLILALGISLFFNYKQYVTIKSAIKYIGWANGRIKELE